MTNLPGEEKLPFETTQEKNQEKPRPDPAKKEIALRGGLARAESVEQQFRLAKLYAESGILPSRFKTAEQVLVALHFAAEHFAATPLTALRQIAVIEGNPTMFGDLPLAIVQRSKYYVGKSEYFLDEKTEKICEANKNLKSPPWAAVCTTWRRINDGPNQFDEHTTVFSMDDARRAGLWDRQTWKKYPQDMLKYKARGRNLKDQFADCLNGLGQGEFDHDVTIDMLPDGKDTGLAGEINSYGSEAGVSDLREEAK